MLKVAHGSLTWCAVAFDGGLGRPSDQLTSDTLVRSSKVRAQGPKVSNRRKCNGLIYISHQYSLAGQTNWPIANALIKVSICLTFIRIFITKPFRIAATTVYILSIAWSIATILVGWVICTPLSELWTKAPGGHCGNTAAAYVSLGVFDVLLDIAVFSLPLPMLYKLQVAKHAKVALTATFGLGLFTIIAGVMRLVTVIQINYLINFTEAEVGDSYWCAIESSVGIIVACSLTLRPLLDRLLTLLKRSFGQLHITNNSRRTGGRKLPSTDLESNENASFVRLHDDHQDLPLEGLQIPQKAFEDHTKRAFFEHV